ncbi:hypothetical protein BDD21_5372 [Thiocapsa rosea]|uniref:Uncharacterized protein n=1 Tax=Thiocapsa rosea TaxID=69360 RepID=A0A495UKN3_9GAMM|nr:hypothetical protein BDD21_5372 [Thiocapsa rosea]
MVPGNRSHPYERRRPVTRVERRRGGLRGRESETRPYAERTLPVTNKRKRFMRMACEQSHLRFNALMGMLFDPEGLRESLERQDGS